MTRKIYPFIPILSILLACCFHTTLLAQVEEVEDTALVQESKVFMNGFVFDDETHNPISGAVVSVITTYPRSTANTSINGAFSIKGLPFGTHKIVVEASGYEMKEIPDIIISEANSNFSLEIKLHKHKNNEQIVIPNPLDKDKQVQVKIIRATPRDLPVNEMAIVSLRSFSREETSRFAGSRQDPSRLLSNYMGMRAQDDYNNNLIIRGNSPYSFQWRLEGVPMPNVGYLGDFNMNGGLANIFSPNVLQQSDVMIGAFSAQYGNASSGIFDAQLLARDAEKTTVSGQAHSSTGVELMLEGAIKTKATHNPITRPEKGYYFINYRLSRFNYLGYLISNELNNANTSPKLAPNFQDLSFKVVIPTKISGAFTFFGMTGFAGQTVDANNNAAAALTSQFVQAGEWRKTNSVISVAGFKHRYYFKESRAKRSYLQTTLANTFLQSKQNQTLFDNNDTTYQRLNDDRKNTIFFSTVYNHRFDQYLTFEGGIQNESYIFNLNGLEPELLNTNSFFESDEKSKANMLQAYTLLLFKPLINMKINLGLHTQWFSMTDSYSVEPRFAFRWEFVPYNFFSFGYGMHSQMQPLQAYFAQNVNDFDPSHPQKINNLDFTRSHHFVIGYDRWISQNWRLHAELYHIEYYNVPVDTLNKVFSMLSYNGGALSNMANMKNDGEGYSQGFELSIEHYFNKGFYALASTSFYRAYYSDYLGRERNLGFNNRIIINVLAGKEIPFGQEKQNTVNIDTRLSYGGRRFSEVVNAAASLANNQSIYDAAYGFSNLTGPYFRADLKIGVTLRKEEGTAHNFYIDLINVSGAKNSNGQYFDRLTQTVKDYRQMPFFLDFGYKVKF